MAGTRLQDHPEYPAAKRLQRSRGRELLRRYGAHGLAIEWVEGPGGDRVPGLVFHVADRSEAAGSIPGSIETLDEQGRPQRVQVRVEVAPPPTFE
jgi:hypothetical protein